MSKSASASVRVLVTDAGGFIAHCLVGFLKERDYRVRGVDLKDPEYAPTAADEFLRVDLCSRLQNPTTASAVTAEGSTVHSTSVVGGDPEW